jgi:hypothetical protein
VRGCAAAGPGTHAARGGAPAARSLPAEPALRPSGWPPARFPQSSALRSLSRPGRGADAALPFRRAETLRHRHLAATCPACPKVT